MAYRVGTDPGGFDPKVLRLCPLLPACRHRLEQSRRQRRQQLTAQQRLCHPVETKINLNSSSSTAWVDQTFVFKFIKLIYRRF